MAIRISQLLCLVTAEMILPKFIAIRVAVKMATFIPVAPGVIRLLHRN